MNIRKNDVLIIIPAFNEEKIISKLLNELFREQPDVDILVVNDGSTDNTAKNAAIGKAIVINHPYNLGIGVSFQTGCRFAVKHNYSYIVRMDGDGQHYPTSLKDMLFSIKNETVDIVVGSRFLGNSKFKSTFLRRIGISLISAALMLITKKKFTDPTSGFCAMNKHAYSFFAENCVEDYPEPEIFLHHLNFRIREIPISMTKRTNGISSINNLKTMYYMYKVLFSIFLSIFRKE